ncbi:hypothetical protein Q7Y30_02035 [Glaesserella parasuis]|nr:hypothetical protein HPSH465_0211 [Glaesserella parasuis H465]MDP0380559.1 hypothetical protein [Glaesserella parasuis]
MISAKDLAQKSTEFSSLDEEFYWRQSSHLAYYAVYHQLVAFSLLQHIDLKQGNGGIHQRAITAIRQHSEQGEELAFYLQKMKKRRVIADYYLESHFSKEEAILQQALMQQCLTYLK